ncbi:hypothetical protein SAMD00019534_083990 [Acytostelium subglobosum LB1]|uniref:hypothetical protein n=1 Tax=Acytostelium subglobosum LB1 TaxID=1410327 RepID=UPI000644AE7C|nr:hypothetical protein SAMD00019534_083990 [Acytostelium subglobosum LB1]GAM25224.1 hypothetical protein SAMD00019534_083990 [Acytostelium subglobosum LB1]|eukprot:XP_012751744.1 hypothetical protein SAMD00019534_083990 [Acytostelium subglobosum LB1]
MFPIRGSMLALSSHIYVVNSPTELFRFNVKSNQWSTQALAWSVDTESNSRVSQTQADIPITSVDYSSCSDGHSIYVIRNDKQVLSILAIDVQHETIRCVAELFLKSVSLESCCMIGQHLFFLVHTEQGDHTLCAFDLVKQCLVQDINNLNSNSSTGSSSMGLGATGVGFGNNINTSIGRQQPRNYRMLAHNSECIYFLNQSQPFFGVQRESKFFAYSIEDNSWLSLPEPKNSKILHCFRLTSCLYCIGEDYAIEVFDTTRNQWY